MAQELKARTARSIADEEEMLELGADCSIEPTQVYEKSDVDKVIAELERDIVKLKSSLKYLVVRGLIDGPVKKAVEDLLKEVEDAH